VSDASHVDEIIEKVVYTESGLSGEEFESCTFRGCDFSGADLSGSLLTDCRLVGCNLTMVKVGQAGLRDVTFVNCKVVGVDFGSCLPFLFSVGFEECNLDYSHFIKCKLKKTEFKGCTVRDADFTEADLTDASFLDCDLSNAVFNRTNLTHADFRTARNYSIDPEENTVRRARFSLSGVAGLLRRYDLILE
jgi:fluoroquinolone resistance protein